MTAPRVQPDPNADLVDEQYDRVQFITLADGTKIERVLTRRGGFPTLSQEECETFIEVLAMTGNKVKAAEASGRSRVAFYMLAQQNELFAQTVDMAARIGTEYLETVAIQQATEGVHEPVYHNGICIDTVRRFPNNSMLQFLLKSYNPDVFRDRQEITTTDAIDKPPHLIKSEADAVAMLKLLREEMKEGDDESDT